MSEEIEENLEEIRLEMAMRVFTAPYVISWERIESIAAATTREELAKALEGIPREVLAEAGIL